MLSKEEELRVASCIHIVKHELSQKNSSHDLYLSLATQLWLAEKLKETNDELSQVSSELYTLNKEFANYVEAHE